MAATSSSTSALRRCCNTNNFCCTTSASISKLSSFSTAHYITISKSCSSKCTCCSTSNNKTTLQQKRSISVIPQPHQSERAAGTVKILKKNPINKTGLGMRNGETKFVDELSEADKERIKDKLHDRMWNAVCNRDWDEWEQTIALFKENCVAYDEVTYTLIMHGYVLSHRHRSENAYLVLEEMRACGFIHRALIRLNERMLNSYFELLEMDARPVPSAWQNILRLCYHSAARYQSKRQVKIRDELLALEPNDVLKLTPQDIQDRYLLDGKEDGTQKLLDFEQDELDNPFEIEPPSEINMLPSTKKRLLPRR